MTVTGRVGCFPGSFNPPTVAHLAIAAAARSACRLDRVDLVLSRVALAKESVVRPRFGDRVAVLASMVQSRSSWLGLVVSHDQLLVDLARGYDVLVLGADKWAQVTDPSFYGGSTAARDAALAALPALALAPREGVAAAGAVDPPATATVLTLPGSVAEASSTAVREAGRVAWMVEEAAAFDRATGAWSDPDRYDVWVRSPG